MKVLSTSLKGVLLIEPPVFEDKRGFFMETYQQKKYMDSGIDSNFLQDNLSFSLRGTLRGLHYQLPHAQAKLVQVIKGEIFDVTVDIRIGSPTLSGPVSICRVKTDGSCISLKGLHTVSVCSAKQPYSCINAVISIRLIVRGGFYGPILISALIGLLKTRCCQKKTTTTII